MFGYMFPAPQIVYMMELKISITEFHSPLQPCVVILYSYPGLQAQVALSTHVPFAKHMIRRLVVLWELAAHDATPVTTALLPRIGRAISG